MVEGEVSFGRFRLDLARRDPVATIKAWRGSAVSK
jgi:hypothetical protein